jgi:pentapeptide MXKDX repeat protein
LKLISIFSDSVPDFSMLRFYAQIGVAILIIICRVAGSSQHYLTFIKHHSSLTNDERIGFKIFLQKSGSFRGVERNDRSWLYVSAALFNSMEKFMKKLLIATAVTLMCGSAFAQTSTGPGNQNSDMNKPGMTNSGSGMNSGTTGSTMQKEGMSKEGMSKSGMKNDSMSKDGMKKDNMSK